MKMVLFLLINLFISSKFLLMAQVVKSINHEIDSLKTVQSESLSQLDLIDSKIEISNNEKESFFNRNEGQIVGSFLAGIVAVFTVLLANYFSRKLDKNRRLKEKEYKENIYCNLLVCIHSDLELHDYFSGHLHKSIIEINRITKEQKKLITDRVQSKLSLALIDQCRLKMLDFDKTNTEILSRINSYYNLLEGIKTDLDFSKLLALKEDFISDEEHLKGIDNYLKTLIKNIETLNNTRDKLKNLIIKDLQTFNHIMINDQTKQLQKN